MYETEANSITLASDEIPAEVLLRFAESRKTVTERTLIPWGEHCTECVWPTCYSTCDLFSPRYDGRCRRFVDGMVRMDCPGSLNGYLLKIRFKRWAKLWSPANSKLYPLEKADRLEKRDFQIGGLIKIAPPALQKTLAHKRYSMKKRTINGAGEVKSEADCLLVECYNPNSGVVPITLSIRRDNCPIPFQELLPMQPGFNRHRIHTDEIERRVHLSAPFSIDLTPNEIPEGTTLFFGAMDFVRDNASGASNRKNEPSRKSKCVVWDLDNTLWDGILVEDGLANLRLKTGIVEILKELDQRGILISAASKNNEDEARAALRHFGIEEYFLYPQISWDPKGKSLPKIAENLNIGIEALLFVDDSPFERAEVHAACPEVMTLDAAESGTLLTRPECQVPVTAESKKRRLFYKDQERREVAQGDFMGEYSEFLKGCDLRLTIRPMTGSNIERVYELTQRTNQMNFSGNRYSREQLENLLSAQSMDTYVLDCKDRFGSYGTIGFSLVNRPEARMTDLMFSCRVQGKRVEHSFVSYLVRKYRELGNLQLRVDYRKTKKNAGPGRVFEDLGFNVLSESEGVTQLEFPVAGPAPDECLVSIEEDAIRHVREMQPVN